MAAKWKEITTAEEFNLMKKMERYRVFSSVPLFLFAFVFFLLKFCRNPETAADDFTGVGNQDKGTWLLLTDKLSKLYCLGPVHYRENYFFVLAGEGAGGITYSGTAL